MSHLDLNTVKAALETAGFEIYRVRAEEIHVAERVRLHLMDSGVRIGVADQQADVEFTARSQRSDFPNAGADALFDRVRAKVGAPAEERGFEEKACLVHRVTDPVDESRVLDVWHEVVYRKRVAEVDDVVAEVRWALELEKYAAE